jgi:hypothetical protein
MERIKKTTPQNDGLDMTKPLPIDRLMQEADNSMDCYTKLWKPDDSMCSLCAALEMCGILFHARQSKLVKEREKERGYLDMHLFDTIEYEDVLAWLRKKPRTEAKLLEAITKLSNCSDEETVRFWCRSFLKQHKAQLIIKDGTITAR